MRECLLAVADLEQQVADMELGFGGNRGHLRQGGETIDGDPLSRQPRRRGARAGRHRLVVSADFRSGGFRELEPRLRRESRAGVRQMRVQQHSIARASGQRDRSQHPHPFRVVSRATAADELASRFEERRELPPFHLEAGGEHLQDERRGDERVSALPVRCDRFHPARNQSREVVFQRTEISDAREVGRHGFVPPRRVVVEEHRRRPPGLAGANRHPCIPDQQDRHAPRDLNHASCSHCRALRESTP